MVSVSGTTEYTGVGKNVGIETNPYIIMTSSTCIWRIPFDLFSDSEKSATLALPNLIFIMQGEITLHVPLRVLLVCWNNDSSW